MFHWPDDALAAVAAAEEMGKACDCGQNIAFLLLGQTDCGQNIAFLLLGQTYKFHALQKDGLKKSFYWPNLDGHSLRINNKKERTFRYTIDFFWP